MPREIRHIILSREEFVGALKSYKRTDEHALPHGDIDSYTISEAKTLQVNMRTYYGGSQQNIVIDLAAEHIIRILVRFCIENNIMLPMNSRKTYETRSGEFVLIVKMEM